VADWGTAYVAIGKSEEAERDFAKAKELGIPSAVAYLPESA